MGAPGALIVEAALRTRKQEFVEMLADWPEGQVLDDIEGIVEQWRNFDPRRPLCDEEIDALESWVFYALIDGSATAQCTTAAKMFIGALLLFTYCNTGAFPARESQVLRLLVDCARREVQFLQPAIGLCQWCLGQSDPSQLSKPLIAISVALLAMIQVGGSTDALTAHLESEGIGKAKVRSSELTDGMDSDDAWSCLVREIAGDKGICQRMTKLVSARFSE